jgi:hypothetical protein
MDLMNPAQLHLALTHLPVVGALLAAATLSIGALTRSPATRRFGLALLLFAGLSAIPTYLTGEGAEEIVEDRPGVSEAIVERHEDAAGYALALVLLGGAVAAGSLLAARLGREQAARALFAGAVALALVDTAVLGWVAHLGGEIRHDEIRVAALGGGADASAGETGDD